MAQPTVRDATMASSMPSSSSAGQRPPGIRHQLRIVVALYQRLTNVYFLLIEQRASTSTAATRSSLTTQMAKLRDVVCGQTSSTSGADARGQQSVQQSLGLLASLRPEHVGRIRGLDVFKPLLPANRLGTTASSRLTAIPTIEQALDAIETLDTILAELMHRAQKHAQNQARIRSLVSQVELRDTSMVQSIRRLAVLRDRCQRLVKLGNDEEEAIQHAEKNPLSYDDILRYGRTLSQTTTAPPGFKLQLDEPEGGGEQQAQDGVAKPKQRKPLYQADADDVEGRSGQIPPHLQDKLPFPSVDAIRRGASEVQPPTWSMFQRGIMQAEQCEGHGHGAEAGQQMEVDILAEQQMKNAPASVPKPKQRPAPVDEEEEEEEEGFGLDLN